MKKGPINMNAMITRWMLLAVLLAGGGFSYQVHAEQLCYFQPISKNDKILVRAGEMVVSSFDAVYTAPKLLGEFHAGKIADYACSAWTGETARNDWYGKTVMGTVKKLPYVSTAGNSYDRALLPTSMEGVYYSVYIIETFMSARAYIPTDYQWVREFDDLYYKNTVSQVNLGIEIWQMGNIGPIGNGLAAPTKSGELGRFGGGKDPNIPVLPGLPYHAEIRVYVDASTFMVKFPAPTCNLSVSPTTIDFGDVGNSAIYTSHFTLKNSNCVGALGVTLKLTSTKTAYDNNGLAILANTTTGTSAASGRGVAVAYEGSPRKYLAANDPNSTASIDFGSMVNAKDILMVGVLTCTSGNKSACDNVYPGAFTASGTISATYR